MSTKGHSTVIGTSLQQIGTNQFITGRAVFGADTCLPGMLFGKLVHSPYAHARIKRIDVSKALALEGVKAVVTGKDFPPISRDAHWFQATQKVDMWPIAITGMARDKVLYHYHPVAAVAAVDPFIAEEAARLIEVEYEPLPVVSDLLEAMKPSSPVVDENVYTTNMQGDKISTKPSNVAKRMDLGRGDVKKGFAEADAIVERTYRVGIAHQGFIEPYGCVAQVEPDGRVTVWASSQGAFPTQLQLAVILDMPQNQIKVIPTEIGGGFGGKFHVTVEPVAVLLARKAGQPVKIAMTREEVLRGGGPAPPAIVKAKVGCKKDGTLTALELIVVMDAGCAAGSPVGAALMMGPGPYKVNNLRLVGYDVLTNKPRFRAYRAPGAPVGIYPLNQIMDELAQKIGMDRLEFLIKNATQEGDPQPMGSPFAKMGYKQILQQVKESEHWNSKLEGSNRGRGLGVGAWALGGGGGMVSSCTITLHRDGTASLVVGSVDLTGTRTAMVQMTADELGLNPDKISIAVGDTDTAPFTDVSAGSRTTRSMGAAVRRACQDLLAQLKPRAASALGVKEDEITFADGNFRVAADPAKTASLAQVVVGRDGVVTGTGSAAWQGAAPEFAAQLADVEVDPETGKVKILRFSAFQDVGRAINPSRIEAQMQGGASQGIGWALTEELIFDRQGKVLNASLLDYRQPTMADLPMIECQWVEVPSVDGPHGVRGVGEPPILPSGGALANAIARATGVRVLEMPMTPERIVEAIRTGDGPKIDLPPDLS